jgi:hypothetical protein
MWKKTISNEFLAWIPQTEPHSKAQKWSWWLKEGFSSIPLTYPKNAAGITKTIWTTLNALPDMQLKLSQTKTSNTHTYTYIHTYIYNEVEKLTTKNIVKI